MRILTSEQVSDGHPDKICDQVADAVVTDCLQHDPDSRVAIECLLKNDRMIIAGELSSRHEPDYRELVDQIIERIGRERLDYPSGIEIEMMVKKQSPDIALGVEKGGTGDQGMMYGYTTNETPELLPVPFVVATRFLRILKNHPSWMFRADAKAQVSCDRDTGRITTFLCSVQHSPDAVVTDFRHIIEKVMVIAASEYALNTDFVKLVNPTGRFVIGGSFADCGVTGRKLACDTYGGIGHIGGGALSGKDPSKVDRSAAYMGRKIARDIVLSGYADKAEIQIAYAIGLAQPVSMNIDCFDTERQLPGFIEQFVMDTYDLTPEGIRDFLRLADVDYNDVSAYGHFGKAGLPWEE